MDKLAVVAFMVLVTERLVEGIIKPAFVRYKLDKLWLMYVAWVLGAILTFATGVNLFASYLPSEEIGRILTAIVAGGGANLVSDLFGGEKRRKD